MMVDMRRAAFMVPLVFVAAPATGGVSNREDR
jgi:hypothetical protein